MCVLGAPKTPKGSVCSPKQRVPEAQNPPPSVWGAALMAESPWLPVAGRPHCRRRKASGGTARWGHRARPAQGTSQRTDSLGQPWWGGSTVTSGPQDQGQRGHWTPGPRVSPSASRGGQTGQHPPRLPLRGVAPPWDGRSLTLQPDQGAVGGRLPRPCWGDLQTREVARGGC